MNVKKLPPDMGKTSDLLDITTPIELLEASIAISVHPACEVFQIISWPLPPAIWYELVKRRWMLIASPISLIPEIDPPQPPGLGSAGFRARTLTGASSA
jgi:hypothetical protein